MGIRIEYTKFYGFHLSCRCNWLSIYTRHVEIISNLVDAHKKEYHTI